MASVRRREVEVDGKVYRPGKYYVRYRDVQGKDRVLAAFTDKRASEQLARQIEELTACRQTGTPLSAHLRTAIGRLPERLLKRLRRAGLLSAAQRAGAKRLEAHLADWAEHLRRKGDTEQYITQRSHRVERLLGAAGAEWWRDIDADRVEAALADLRDEEGLSVSTVNAYRSAGKAFCRWLYRTGKAPERALRHLSRENPNGDRRLHRRALKQEEAVALIEAARESETREIGRAHV